MGLRREDLAEADLEIWPETDAAVRVFTSMQTQWRVGASGATGLDYSTLPFVFRMTDTPRNKWPDVFDDLRILENTALEKMHANRSKK